MKRGCFVRVVEKRFALVKRERRGSLGRKERIEKNKRIASRTRKPYMSSSLSATLFYFPRVAHIESPNLNVLLRSALQGKRNQFFLLFAVLTSASIFSRSLVHVQSPYFSNQSINRFLVTDYCRDEPVRTNSTCPLSQRNP